jgi:erythromycin esterase-like protein
MVGLMAFVWATRLAGAGVVPAAPATPATPAALVAAARAACRPIVGSTADYDSLFDALGAARIVMLGEATHGSREFHRERLRITRRLVEERGFQAVVLEAPWQPVRRMDAFIGGVGADAGAALGDLRRFPRWMWRNVDVRDFLEQLRALNDGRAPAQRVRLFGMDLYGVPESADAVVRQVARHSIAAAALARQRYACFDDYLPEPQFYGRAVAAGLAPSCAVGAQAQLDDLAAAQPAHGDDDAFSAWQSARVVRDGEDYYRAMYRPDVSSWNLRERHMADTIHDVLARLGPDSRIVVWAHNIHQGDARATDQAALGEISLGQLMRERYGAAALLVGFTTYRGQVRAAANWGTPDRVWRLRPALADSWSGLLHRTGRPACLLVFAGQPALATLFATPRLERAVGVAYEPRTERRSHYFNMRLARQFDAVVHLDVTTAVEPLR